jgi:hypothetical protein
MLIPNSDSKSYAVVRGKRGSLVMVMNGAVSRKQFRQKWGGWSEKVQCITFFRNLRASNEAIRPLIWHVRYQLGLM